MADVDRIAPPGPTLPPPVGRNVGGKRSRTPHGGQEPAGEQRQDPRAPEPEHIEHIDEYV